MNFNTNYSMKLGISFNTSELNTSEPKKSLDSEKESLKKNDLKERIYQAGIAIFAFLGLAALGAILFKASEHKPIPYRTFELEDNDRLYTQADLDNACYYDPFTYKMTCGKGNSTFSPNI
jgi:hypothetical protein